MVSAASPINALFLIAGASGCPAQALGDELAKRRATCLYAETVETLHAAFPRAPAQAILLDPGATREPAAMANLAARWPAAKRIVVGASPPAGPVKFDFHFPQPQTPADWTRAVVLSTQLARSENAGPVLVIDDSRTMRALAILALERAGRPAIGADAVEAALGLIERYRFEAVLTDLFMAGMGGIAGIQLLRARAPQLAVIAMSGGLDARMAKNDALTAAVKIGADHALSKPFQPEDLVAAIEAGILAARGRTQAPTR